MAGVRETAYVGVQLCTWQVKRAWYKNLLAKLNPRQNNYQPLLDSLEDIMYGKFMDHLELVSKIKSFVKIWEPKEPNFIKYFKTEWMSKASKWVICFRGKYEI